jgi:hypothetical protein
VRSFFASIVLVFLIYGRALWYEFVRPAEAEMAKAVGLTDTVGVLHGLMLNLSRVSDDPTGFSALWRPTVNLVYLISGWLGGGAAWPFHLFSLLLLSLTAWRASRAVAPGAGRTLVLLLVCLHPMMGAAVLDVSAMPSLLLAMCGVFAVTTKKWRSFWWTYAALGSHEAAIFLPFIAMALQRDVHGEARGPRRWQWPVLGVGAWFSTQGILAGAGMLSHSAMSLPRLDGAQQSASLVWFYLGRLFVPFVPVYSRTLPNLDPPWPALAWAVLLLSLLFVLRIGQSRKQPAGPGFAAGLVVILLTLLGACGLWTEDPVYGEAVLAFPIVGLAWLLASRAPLRFGSWALVPIFAGLSFMRVSVWSNPVQLWAESHRAVPQDIMVAFEYGRRIVHKSPAKAVGILEHVLAGDGGPKRHWLAHEGIINAWLSLDEERRALPHLAQLADPGDPENSWLLVRRCLLETQHGMDEADYQEGHVLAPLAQVCQESARRYPLDASLVNAAGMEAAMRGDSEEARYFLQRAVQLAPHDASFRRNFSRIPMHVTGWGQEETISPDPSAAP